MKCLLSARYYIKHVIHMNWMFLKSQVDWGIHIVEFSLFMCIVPWFLTTYIDHTSVNQWLLVPIANSAVNRSPHFGMWWRRKLLSAKQFNCATAWLWKHGCALVFTGLHWSALAAPLCSDLLSAAAAHLQCFCSARETQFILYWKGKVYLQSFWGSSL